jgi:hypothetical protein
MRFRVSNNAFMCGLELEREWVDLTLGGLGDDILDELEDCMSEDAWDERAPDGSRWERLRSSTVKHKGSNRIGVVSGSLFAGLRNGTRIVRRGSLHRQHPDARSGKLDGFHNGNPRTGQPPRRIIGWSDRAKDYARRAVAGG